ncbi:MAG: hypothetical protein AAES65_19430 [Candidatus Thiodiazotropha sp. (ex. Lucinoma kazani)]
MAGTAFESMMIKEGVDQTSVEGAANLPYRLENIQIDLHSPILPVPVQWWRRRARPTHTAFAVECFVDELAEAVGKVPAGIQALIPYRSFASSWGVESCRREGGVE